MKTQAIVTAKGAITIPKRIRERNRIGPGTTLEISEDGDRIVLERARRRNQTREKRDAEFAAYLDEVTGTMDIGMSTDEYMEFLRGE